MRIVRPAALAGFALASLWASTAFAANINFVSGAVGKDIEVLKELVKPWEADTGNTVTVVPMPSSTTDQFAQYRLWLAAGNADVDIYQTDVIWAPQLSDGFIDLTDAAKDVIGEHFPSIVESQTVDGKLVAMPLFTDAPALYYRKDLLEKYGESVPTTWDELKATAQKVQDGEREAGSKDIWGFVWQGNAYEGLTCNALEWIKSYGGGQIVEPDGTISVNNPEAVKALETAASWVNTISPPGVLSYTEEESRGVWQTGNAVFMRNWPYAFALGDGDDSPIKGKFDVAPLPSGGAGSAATLGGWNLAVSRFSPNPDVATSLVLFLASAETQSSARSSPASCRRSRRLRRSRNRRGKLADPALEGSVHGRRRASVGADQGQVRQGVVEILVGRARDAVGHDAGGGQPRAARSRPRRARRRRLVAQA